METAPNRTQSFSEVSETAQEYIATQMRLEAEAREALPYQFDTCTRPLGPLRQTLFSCLTCNPPPSDDSVTYQPAGLCYSCSISCHGEHELVELFSKRNFVCDCGTTRIQSSSPCTLRIDEKTGQKGSVKGEEPASTNVYNHNYRNKFCGCGEQYDPAKEKGTMFQCLGLGTTADGGCGEDWWHPECLLGLPRDWNSKAVSSKPNTEQAHGATKTDSDQFETTATDQNEPNEPPLPPGFPDEDSFDHLICYKCVAAFPWIKRYASSPGFLAPVTFGRSLQEEVIDKAVKEKKRSPTPSILKRSAEDNALPDPKKIKITEVVPVSASTDVSSADNSPACRRDILPPSCDYNCSLFVKTDFRDSICRCPKCFPRLVPHPQLLEEEEPYEPPMSESSDGGQQNGHSAGGSTGTKSLLDRGEAALSNMDRVRAIEGVMAYNNLRDKVKAFLKPFAESGQAVGAEDIKEYFEKLRGDDEAIKRAAAQSHVHANDSDENHDDTPNGRKGQQGY